MSFGVGTPSLDFRLWLLCSSRMMSMHSSTHSSQMNTVGPAMSLRTSCWLFPQNEQYRVVFDSPLMDLVIGSPRSRVQLPRTHVRPHVPAMQNITALRDQATPTPSRAVVSDPRAPVV